LKSRGQHAFSSNAAIGGQKRTQYAPLSSEDSIFLCSVREPEQSIADLRLERRLHNPKIIIALTHDVLIGTVSVGVALYLRLGDTVFELSPAGNGACLP
jgi:hypothetical protein